MNKIILVLLVMSLSALASPVKYEEFKLLSKKVFLEPLINNSNTYVAKVKSFSKSNDNFTGIQYINEERDLSNEGELDPYRLTFSLSLNKSYIESSRNFLKEISQKVLLNPEKEPKNSVSIADNAFIRYSKLRDYYKKRELYQLSAKEFKILKKIIDDFHREYKGRLKISLLDENNQLIKETYYSNFSSYYKGYSFKDTKEQEISQSSIDVLVDNKSINVNNDNWFFDTFSQNNSDFIFNNNFLLTTIFYLGDEDLKYLKKIEIEVQWVKVK